MSKFTIKFKHIPYRDTRALVLIKLAFWGGGHRSAGKLLRKEAQVQLHHNKRTLSGVKIDNGLEKNPLKNISYGTILHMNKHGDESGKSTVALLQKGMNR